MPSCLPLQALQTLSLCTGCSLCLCVMAKVQVPQQLSSYRKELIKSGWNHLKRDDSACRFYAFLNVCHFLSVFVAPEKITLQVRSAVWAPAQVFWWPLQSQAQRRATREVLLAIVKHQCPGQVNLGLWADRQVSIPGRVPTAVNGRTLQISIIVWLDSGVFKF